MTKVVVDSDIIIDFLRTGGGALPDLFILQRDSRIELFLSTVTTLELFAGKSSKATEVHLGELISGFAVVPLSSELARFAGALKRDHRMSVAFADLVVAATALSIGAKIATRNTRHFKGIPKLRFYS